MAEISDDYEWPQPLKANLELLAKLQENEQVRQKVIEDIQKEVKKYLNDVDQFSGSTGYLLETIRKSTELRKGILKTDKLNTFQHYRESFQNSDTDKYSQLLIDNIFPSFGCLYYMYFECAYECIFIDGGGEWHDERCDGSSGEKYLNHWLKDEKPSTEDSEDATETSEGGTKHMIKRGFKQDELSTKKGEYLFPKSESEAAPLLYYLQGAQLQFALYYMLFLPVKWNDAQSGHAVLFLEAFCEKVSGDQFTGKHTNGSISIENLKSSCKTLKDKITALKSSNTIVPVAWTPEVQYKNLLEARHFWNYIEWLRKNLEQLIKSLTEMANDASNWDYTELITSETFGPYPWGFTFKDPNWDQKKGQLQQQLKQQLSQLTKELGKLKNALTSISKGEGSSKKAAETSSSSTDSTESTASTTSPTSNTSTEESSNSTDSNDSTNSGASTLGGVAGGIGAAAATGAAAYAGSGVLGPVAESIGKFFKGLLF